MILTKLRLSLFCWCRIMHAGEVQGRCSGTGNRGEVGSQQLTRTGITNRAEHQVEGEEKRKKYCISGDHLFLSKELCENRVFMLY